MPAQITPQVDQSVVDNIALLARELNGGTYLGGMPRREADFDHREAFRSAVGTARYVARADPFGVNAVRTHRDSVVGSSLRLALVPDYEALGVTQKEAQAWVRKYLREFGSWATSHLYDCDAQRKQTLTGLLRTMHDSLYVSGEAACVMKFKESFGPYETCVHVIEPERISTPNNRFDRNIRDGIERDNDGAPIAYWISEPENWNMGDWINTMVLRWDRVPRYTEWGRPIVIHAFDHLRPDMTRGISTFASVVSQMQMLRQYSETELSSAITQAAYAAVIKSDLPVDQAMNVIGAKMDDKTVASYGGNRLAAAMFEYMKMIAPFYGEIGLKYQGAKIPHLMPNENLELLKAEHPSNGFGAFEGAMLRQLAAGLGIDYPALSKNYADVNYSGARAALADVWRSFMVARMHMSEAIGMPIVACHMEEAILKGRVPMLGGMDWLEARPYLVRGMFVGWGKPLIDPEKERKAQMLGLNMGVTTRSKITAEEGEDFEDISDQRSYEEERMVEKGLTPEVVNPELAFSASGETDDKPAGGKK
jgi:lambda family phage portal protein